MYCNPAHSNFIMQPLGIGELSVSSAQAVREASGISQQPSVTCTLLGCSEIVPRLRIVSIRKSRHCGVLEQNRTAQRSHSGYNRTILFVNRNNRSYPKTLINTREV